MQINRGHPLRPYALVLEGSWLCTLALLQLGWSLKKSVVRQVHLAASRWPPLIAIHDVGISRAIGWIRPAGWRAAWPLQVPSNSLDVRTTSSGMGPHILKRRVCLLSTQVLKSTPIFHSGISKIRGAVSHPKPRFKQADSAICLLCISSSVSTASNAWGFSLMAGTRAQDTPIRCLEQGCMGTNATQVVTSPNKAPL